MTGELIVAILLIGTGWTLGYFVLEKAMPGYVVELKATKRTKTLAFISFLLGCGIAMAGLMLALVVPLAIALPVGVGSAIIILYIFLRYFEQATPPEKAAERREEKRKEVMTDLGIKDPEEAALAKLVAGFEPPGPLPAPPEEEAPSPPPPPRTPPHEPEYAPPPERAAEEAGLKALKRLRTPEGGSPKTEKRAAKKRKPKRRAPTKSWYSVKELARKLDVNEITVKRAIYSKKITADMVKGKWRVPRKELDKLKKK